MEQLTQIQKDISSYICEVFKVNYTKGSQNGFSNHQIIDGFMPSQQTLQQVESGFDSEQVIQHVFQTQSQNTNMSESDRMQLKENVNKTVKMQIDTFYLIYFFLFQNKSDPKKISFSKLNDSANTFAQYIFQSHKILHTYYNTSVQIPQPITPIKSEKKIPQPIPQQIPQQIQQHVQQPKNEFNSLSSFLLQTKLQGSTKKIPMLNSLRKPIDHNKVIQDREIMEKVENRVMMEGGDDVMDSVQMMYLQNSNVPMTDPVALLKKANQKTQGRGSNNLMTQMPQRNNKK